LIAPYQKKGIVLDIGTGDGRFVSTHAKANRDKFYIGIDANAKPLEKLSMKATRKPTKGGLPNAIFVQAAVEDLPVELDGIATEIHLNFPWGSLLRAVAVGDPAILRTLHRIGTPPCALEIVIGIDPVRDCGELDRLNIPDMKLEYVDTDLRKAFADAGFSIKTQRELALVEWPSIETSWARKLSGNDNRRVLRLEIVKMMTLFNGEE
jgi:16S rRNA (adenine(1408)-N(1))-methyltransferase